MILRPPLVLVYHGVGDVPAEHDPDRLFVATRTFIGQIRSLRRRGYGFVTVAQFAERLRGGAPLDGRCAVTFDDGGADNAEELAAVTQALEVPVTLYVCPDLLGRPHPFVAPESGRRLMDADQLRDLARLPGIEIGSHTRTHRDLSRADVDEAFEEMSSSKTALEELVDREVVSFAYPSCGYSEDCPAAAELAGYTSAVTCGPRGGRSPYELRRDMIGTHDRGLRFALKSRGAAHAARRPRRWLTEVRRP